MTVEASVQAAIRLEAARKGVLLWRNNVGALKREDGDGYVRFGLANDSVALNKQFKSGDLIGIRPVVIHPQHVGLTIGQFVSVEVKRPGWKFSGNDREAAQQRWIDLVLGAGGFAYFATQEGKL